MESIKEKRKKKKDIDNPSEEKKSNMLSASGSKPLSRAAKMRAVNRGEVAPQKSTLEQQQVLSFWAIWILSIFLSKRLLKFVLDKVWLLSNIMHEYTFKFVIAITKSLLYFLKDTIKVKISLDFLR